MMIQKITFLLIFFSLSIVSMAAGASEQGKVSEAFRSTDYPLPRFLSLRSNEVYVRTGPGKQFPVQWIFKKKGIPVEITLEYDVWRKIRDYDGHEGWIHKSLLTGKRTGFIQSNDGQAVHKKPNKKSALQVFLEKDVLVDIFECQSGWCYVSASGYKGWLKQQAIWGVYENEEFD